MNTREELLAKPMLAFVAKVDRGEARSKRSYAEFIEALSTVGFPIPGHPCCERDDDGDGNCDIHSAIGHSRYGN